MLALRCDHTQNEHTTLFAHLEIRKVSTFPHILRLFHGRILANGSLLKEILKNSVNSPVCLTKFKSTLWEIRPVHPSKCISGNTATNLEDEKEKAQREI